MNRWFNDISPDHSKPRDYAKGENKLILFLWRYSCSIGMYCGITDVIRVLSWVITVLSCFAQKERIGTYIFIGLYFLFDLIWRGAVYYQNTFDRNRRQIKTVSLWMVIVSFTLYFFSRLSDQSVIFHPSVLSSSCFTIFLSNLVTEVHVIRSRHGRISYGLRVGLLFFWGYLACRVLHSCYLKITDFQELSWQIQVYLFPKVVNSKISETNWLSIGTTFFVGCLIILSWSKERPCKAWNPFSAQELGMENGLLDTAIVCISAMLYSVYSGLAGLSFYIMVLLLITDMYTLFLCNSQHIDSLVRRKIIQNMDALSVADRIANSPETGIGEWHGTKGNSVDYESVKRELIAYSQTISSVSKMCLTGNRRISNVARDIVLLATDICLTIKTQTDNCIATLGFIYGMSCLPESILHVQDTGIEKIRAYAGELCDIAYAQDTYKLFFQQFVCGVHYAMVLIGKMVNQVDMQDLDFLEERKSSGEHMGEFITWILEKDIEKGYENWAWLREIRQAIG